MRLASTIGAGSFLQAATAETLRPRLVRPRRPPWHVGLAVAATVVLVGSGAVAAPPSGLGVQGGAVATAAPAATAAGIETLNAGGNAADAAVAAALALAVVHPAAGNLGGGGFAVAHFGQTTDALDFRETAPAAATATMFLGPDGNPVGERSLVGPLAAAVPGSPAGLFELHRRLGRLPWARVVAPAARLAARGFVVTPRLHEELTDSRALLSRFSSSAVVWLPNGQPPAAGAVVKLPKLAALLRAYAAKGPAAVMRGAAAAAIVAASSARGGVLTVADLASYQPIWRPPVRFAAFDWEVASMPLPSSGGIILAQTCAILERLGWAELPRGGADRAHLLAETWRRAFADRFLLGDPATTQAGPVQLLDPAWLAKRAAEVDRTRATPSASIHPWAMAAAREPSETTHLSVVDGEGNAVALTTTLNGSFGCGMLVPELEMLLNNEMDDFAAAPGRPNLYGLVQGQANAVGPGKRMLSSMSPTVAWRGGETLVLGSPGGSHIPTATAQVLLNVVVDGDPLAGAISRPRIHHQWLPDELAIEDGALSPPVREELERRGHRLRRVARLGEVHAVLWHADGGCEGVADARGPGAAQVVTAPARRKAVVFAVPPRQ